MPIKTYPEYPNFFEVQHPLIQHKLTCLRNVNTNKKEFQELTEEITTLLVYEVTKDLKTKLVTVNTPLESCSLPMLDGYKPVILAILRAGIGMVSGFLKLIPLARVAHIGLYRDEQTLNPILYYFKIPRHSENRQFYICDPMLATGGTLVSAIDQLKSRGINKITFVSLLATRRGVERVMSKHPEVKIFTACLDRELNDDGYILPGLGDAGDRLFGTK